MAHLQLQGKDNYSLRWWEDQPQPDGSVARIHQSRVLGHFPSRRAAIIAMQAEIPKIQGMPRSPQATMLLADFIDGCFLPSAVSRLKASTSYTYRRLFEEHRELLPPITLRDFRTVHGEELMQRIHTARGLGKNSLHNIKSLLSGVFKYAKRMGVLDANPMQDVSLPRTQAPADTYAYSLDEIREMLRIVPGRAAAVIAVAAYTGLRRGEIAGLQWGDYRDGMIHVSRSRWLNTMDQPKTRKSMAPVPVIKPLAEILEDWKGTMQIDHPTLPVWMFGSTPLVMYSLERKEIIPFLKDKWRGWHPCRRGLATTLKRLGAEDVVIQAVLRHSNVATTTSCYIKTGREDVAAAMDRLSTEIEGAI